MRRRRFAGRRQAGCLLTSRPHRVLVAGTSGSGKSRLSRAIGAALGLPYVELDSLFHGPGWEPRSEFRSDVERLAAQPEWVTEWQYSSVRPLLLDRADLLVWVDPPTWLVMWRVVRRTLWRSLRRQELWNGNVEPPLRTFFTDRDHIVRWAWRTRRSTRQRVADAPAARPGLPIVHLRRRRDARQLLASLRNLAGG